MLLKIRCTLSVSLVAMLVSTNVQSYETAYPRVMRYAQIHADGHGILDAEGGKIMFRKGRDVRTEWNIEFGKDGHSIYRSARGSNGRLLGIDPKSRQLKLFDKPGATTTWQIIYAQSRRHSFKGLLVMKVDGEELRLSVDEEGNPVLGGKATILSAFVDGL